MERRKICLTSLYNLIHNAVIQEKDILRLRAIHVEIDQAVQEAYALDEEREPGIRAYESRVASAALPVGGADWAAYCSKAGQKPSPRSAATWGW